MAEVRFLKLGKSRRGWLLAGVALNMALCVPVWAQSAQHTQATSSNDVESIVVTGDRGTKTGLIAEAEVPKSASTIDSDFIQDQPAGSGPLQLLNLLPGVNATNRDPTGLEREQLSMRGFQINEIGVALEGVPLNDTGNFNFYSTEYIDTLNLQRIYVTQGSGDVDTPNFGATGGTIGMVVQRPAAEFHVMAQQALGQDNFRNSFIRLDTGNFTGNNRAFISYSNGFADEWRGAGDTMARQHVDSIIEHDIGESSRVSLESFYNSQEMGQYEALTKAQIAQYGYNFNYAPTFAPIVPGSPGVPENDNNSAALAPNTLLNRSNFIGIDGKNPFDTAFITSKANLQLSDKVHLDLQPYWIYINGNAGIGTYVTGGTLAALGANPNVKNDGNNNDTLLYNIMPSEFEIRTGGVARMKVDLPYQEVVFGIQIEHNNEHEFEPLIGVNPITGYSANQWGNEGAPYETVTYPGGNFVRLEDRRTRTDLERPFLQDTVHLLDDNLTLDLAVQEPFVDRKGLNFLPLLLRTSAGQVAPVSAELEQHKLMPSAGAVYKLDSDNQVFASIAQTFRASDNNPLYFPGTNLGATKPEEAVNVEAGYRYTGAPVIFSATFFNVNYQNREEFQLSPVKTTIGADVGAVTLRGAEMEVGTKPIDGFSLYGSGTLVDSRVRQNILVGIAAGGLRPLPTEGKQMPDTPHVMFAGQLRYDADAFFGELQAKYTGKRYSTMTNDESVGGYSTTDVIAGCRIPEEWTHSVRTSVTLSVTNILDRRYYGGINYSNTAVTTNGVAGSAPSYYVGPPRFFSAKVTAEF